MKINLNKKKSYIVRRDCFVIQGNQIHNLFLYKLYVWSLSENLEITLILCFILLKT